MAQLPLYCHQTRNATLWRIIKPKIRCPENPEAKVIDNVEIGLFRPNFELQELNAGYCSVQRSELSYWENFWGSERNTTTEKELMTVTREECLEMLRWGKCRFGTVDQKIGQTTNTFHTEYSYWQTKTTHVNNCFFTNTSIWVQPGTLDLSSSLADISLCHATDGVCVLSDGAILAWEPAKLSERRFCSFILVDKFAGSLSDRVWIDYREQLAITFSSDRPQRRVQACDKPLIISDQGYAIDVADFSNFFSAKAKRGRRDKPGLVLFRPLFHTMVTAMNGCPFYGIIALIS